MKKKLIVCLCVIMLLCGCTLQNNTSKNNGGKINIVTTVFPLYDFARNVAGDKANTDMLVTFGADVHSYEPTPRDIIKIIDSDLFINLGSSVDEWTDKVTEAADGKSLNTLSAMDSVDIKDEEAVEGMEEERGHSEHTPEPDEHIWTSPKNAELIVKSICSALEKADPSNAGYYKKNAENYIYELNRLDGDIRSAVEGSKRKTVVFADRFPMRYFADEYGLEYFAAFPGCSSESEPSAATISFLIEKVKSEHIPVVFFTETSDGKVADTICEASGAEKLLFHSCHNITKQQFDGKATYISLMKQNLKALQTALN